MTAPIRILLADDHPSVRAGVRASLEAEQDFALVGEAATGDEARRLSEALHPDVLVLDLSMPGPPASETVAHLRADQPDLQIVVLTAHDDQVRARELVALGVGGYVLKDEPLDAVVRAIRAVVRGDTWFSRAIVGGLARRQADAEGVPLLALTARQRQLLRLVARGWDTPRIAAALGVTDNTLRNYLSRLYGTLGVSSRAEAMVRARDHDLADD